MNITFKINLQKLAAISTFLSWTEPWLHAQGTAFTYQGRLNNGGTVASGSYDLTFTIFATNTTGTVFAGPLTRVASDNTHTLNNPS